MDYYWGSLARGRDCIDWVSPPQCVRLSPLEGIHYVCYLNDDLAPTSFSQFLGVVVCPLLESRSPLRGWSLLGSEALEADLADPHTIHYSALPLADI